MKLSHSRVECFVKCPYQFKLRYIRKYKTLPTDDPASPLVLGHALHTGIEKDVQSAIEEYYSAYPIITDRHIEEAIKLEYWLPKIKEVLPAGGLHEIEIGDDDFVGYIDYIVPIEEVDGVEYYDLYDFKYSNNVDSYMESGQLHEYKYYFEKQFPNTKIRNMYFMFVPKCQLKIKYKNKTNKRDETLNEFRRRIYDDLESKQIIFTQIDYKTEKVIEFLTNSIRAMNCETFDKNPTRLCDWCEYKRYCQSEGKDDLDMQLPSTQRRNIEGNSFKKIWFYGLPFSGKTYLANQFDTPLMLNTDGNYKQVDAPVIRIMDEVTTEGRITKRKYAWEVFQDTVAELEKHNNDFKTIVVDLLEDVYDACRVKVCIDNGWDHESDDSFKAYDIVRSEFLRTLKRLLNLNYNIVLISHEDTSRDIMKKTGDKITAIKPNLAEKIALKVAGMVDICCRIVNDEGKRTINFKSSEVEFGGGRLNIAAKNIPCEYKELMKVYGDNGDKTRTVEARVTNQETPAEDKPVETATAEPVNAETPERKPRTRKAREVVEEEVVPTQPEEVVEESEEVKIAYEAIELAENMNPVTVEEGAPRRRRRRVEE